MAVVLVVDDDWEIRKLYGVRLKRAGHEALFAEDGKQGLAAAQEHNPDVIVIDYNMPVMRGDVMLEKLRESEWGKDSKVIMISGLNLFGRYNFDQADRIIQKPITGLELLKAIDELTGASA